MTELEQLKADLATLEKALNCLKRHECPNVALGVESICDLMKKNIAALEAQQATADEWAEVKRFIDQSHDEGSNLPVKKYIRHLEAKVAVLENELRWERIDGG